MRYELFLRSAAPLDEPLIREIQAAHADLHVSAYSDDDGIQGVDLGVDLEDPAAARLLCKAAFSLAEQHGLRIFDPQLGHPVSEADREQITTQVERTSAFMQSMPVSMAGAAQGTEGEGMAPTTRLWLWIGGALVGALLLSQGLTCLFAD